MVISWCFKVSESGKTKRKSRHNDVNDGEINGLFLSKQKGTRCSPHPVEGNGGYRWFAIFLKSKDSYVITLITVDFDLRKKMVSVRTTNT